MGNTNTTIELNGKRYDARTGRVIGQPSVVSRSIAAVKKVSSAGNVDGFFRSRTARSPSQAQAAKRKPQKAQTLMRHVVKKPNFATPLPTPQATRPAKATAADNHNQLLRQRFARAKHVTKSPLIQRFTDDHKQVVKKTAALPVKAAPAHHITSTAVAKAPALPVPRSTLAHDRITDAMNHATSHQQSSFQSRKSLRHRAARRLKTTPRVVSFSAATLAVIILGSFIAFQNAPNFAMRIASAKAGFHATLPGYQPAGFALNGPIQSSPGQVSIKFHSNTDARSFAVTQKPSNWTSESLLSNFVASSNQPYQTYQEKGRTIYIYGDANATWVNGGVWYNIEGNASLNSNQLLSLANSI